MHFDFATEKVLCEKYVMSYSISVKKFLKYLMFLIKLNSIPWEMTLSCHAGCESEDSTFQSSIKIAEFYNPCESSAFMLDFKA